MADYRQIHTRIWKDAWFMELDTEDKLFFVYLFSNERASVAGIYELSQKVMAFETGLTKDRIASALDRFKAARKVLYENGIVWVVNLRKYNENNSPKVVTRLQKDLSEIPDCKLKKLYLGYHEGKIHDLYGIDTVSIPGSENITEQEHEHEQEKEHEQDKKLGADAPSKPQKASGGGKKQAEYLDHPAVILYRDKMLVTPNPAGRKAIAEKVTDLKKWESTLKDWLVNKWNPQNLAGMLNKYSGGDKHNGTKTQQDGLSIIREWGAKNGAEL